MHQIQRNANGAFYSDGVGFDELKWTEIVSLYERRRIRVKGTCTIKELANLAKVGYSSARKAIQAYHASKQGRSG